MRLVTNVLYKWNDASLITLLCTAEGFSEMWALLKLSKQFTEELQKLALPAEYVHAFEAYSIIHKLTLTYPINNLLTFKFACTPPSPCEMNFFVKTSSLNTDIVWQSTLLWSVQSSFWLIPYNFIFMRLTTFLSIFKISVYLIE